MSKFIWQNGSLVEFDSAVTHVMSHSLHYGSGIFEGIRSYEIAPHKIAILALDEHLQRLFDSAAPLSMVIPYTKQQLHAAIIDTIMANNLQDCYIRPLIYYGLPPSNVRIRPDPQTPVEVVIYAYCMGEYLPNRPLSVKISDTIRIHPQSTAVHAKICGHYVNSLQALLQIQGNNYDEVIMLDFQGNVAEGSSDNIFIVKDNVLYTPQLGSILAGITRKIIIELAQLLHYQVRETTINPAMLFTADEVFFTGTAVEVRGAGTIDDIKIGTGNTGAITKILATEYLAICLAQGKLNYSSIVATM